MTIILFLIILAILVLVHEFGHFIVAKKSGIRVDEFGLGFPPRLFGIKRGETTYSINLIPFGGFVKIFGENPDADSMSGPDSGRSFINKNRGIQVAVLIAGIVSNILFAWLLISIGFMSGLPTSVTESNAREVRGAHLTITNVQLGTPAAKAGVSAGDKILAISDSHNHTLTDSGTSITPEQLQQFIAVHPEQLTLHIARGTKLLDIDALPVAGIVEGRVALGISMDVVGTLRLPVHKALYEGAKLTASLTKAVASGLAQFIYQAFTGQAHLSEVSGPVGIAGLVGSASRLGFIYLLSFTAFISINLAVLNLIPFPALDGGRILFVLIESIRRKNINPRIANTVNTVGFVLLITLMLVVTYKDIVKLF